MTDTYSFDAFIDLLLDTAEYDHPDEPLHELRLPKLEITTMCARVLDALGGSDCKWCGIDTFDTSEMYMVTDEIWRRYGPPTNGLLCIGCIEDRMGRQLQPDDFKDVPLNTDDRFRRSDRLRDRLAGKTQRMTMTMPAAATDHACQQRTLDPPANNPTTPVGVKSPAIT